MRWRPCSTGILLLQTKSPETPGPGVRSGNGSARISPAFFLPCCEAFLAHHVLHPPTILASSGTYVATQTDISAGGITNTIPANSLSEPAHNVGHVPITIRRKNLKRLLNTAYLPGARTLQNLKRDLEASRQEKDRGQIFPQERPEKGGGIVNGP